MTIYSSDYNARTREQINDRAQRSREVAVTAAARILSATLDTRSNVTPAQLSDALIEVAKSLDTFIQLG